MFTIGTWAEVWAIIYNEDYSTSLLILKALIAVLLWCTHSYSKEIYIGNDEELTSFCSRSANINEFLERCKNDQFFIHDDEASGFHNADLVRVFSAQFIQLRKRKIIDA